MMTYAQLQESRFGIASAWDAASPSQRREWIIICGWTTRHGAPTRRGCSIAASDWTALSPAAQNVLARHIAQA